MKKEARKLTLCKETVRTLQRESLEEVAGGTNITCFVTCHLACPVEPGRKTDL